MHAFARCMRAHGVPNYPDPVFPVGGVWNVEMRPDRSSPALQRVVRACNR
jgi:hypothetical protein